MVPAEPARPIPPARRQITEAAGIGLLFVVSFVGHLLLARGMAGPIIQTDEVGYLGEANLFGHGVGLLYQTVPYHPGYGFLLAPVAAFTTAPTALYRAALVLNAGALAGLSVAAYLLARRIIGRRPAACAAVAIAVSAYPAFIGYGNVAVEASVFVAVCAFVALAVASAVDRGAPWMWGLAGVLAGFCFCLHPIGPAIVVGVVAAAALGRQGWRRRLTALAATALGAQATTVLTVLLLRRIVSYTKTHLLNPGVVPHGAAPAAQPVITRSQNLINTYTAHPAGQVSGMLYEAAGQSWYVAVATGGIALIGAWVALRAVWRVTRGRSTNAADAVGVFVAVVAALGFATSVHHWILGASGGPQSDMLIYGRFNEHLLAPLLVIAFCELRALRDANARVVAAYTVLPVALIAATGWLIQHGRTAAALRRPAVTFNVLGIEPLLRRLGFIDVALISVIGGATVVIAVILAAEWGLLVAAPLVAASWLAVGVSGASAMVHDSHVRTDQRTVLHGIDLVTRTVGAPHCVGYDRTVETQWTLDTDQVFLPDTLMHPFDSVVREQPCSDVVISDRLDLAKSYPGARLMAAENYEHTRLWVLPGAVQDRLIGAGLLLAPGFPSALPPPAYRSRITPAGPVAGTVAPGATFTLAVDVRHAGVGAPWPSRYALDGVQSGWVDVVTGWAKVGSPFPTRASAFLDGGGRADLPHEVWPGETVRVVVHAAAVDPQGRPLAPGRYQLQVGLVQEGFTFFADQNDGPLVVTVTVR